MKIEKILIEDQMAPIGLDEKKPAFSWLLTAEEGEQNLMPQDVSLNMPDTALYHRLVCRQAYLHLTHELWGPCCFCTQPYQSLQRIVPCRLGETANVWQKHLSFPGLQAWVV